MGHQPLAHTTPELWGHTVPALELVTGRHQAALDALHRNLERGSALTVLIGEGKFEANHVVGAFLSSLDEHTTVVRLTKPYDDAIAGMREINRALGFEPKDLSLSDLDNILEMFLSFQRKHRRRTILCIEQAHLQARWLMEHVQRLLDMERSSDFGLMVLLSGQPRLIDLFEEPPLAAVRAYAGRFVKLPAFTLAETTEFLRRRVEASGTTDISQLFEFDAISRIHELSGGVPDLVGTLCFKCLQIANQQQSGPVTEQLVVDASKRLWQKPAVEARGNFTVSADDDIVTALREKLVITRDGHSVLDFTLGRDRYLVGRAEFADISLPSQHVSRRHALIIKNDDIRILDLGSTNGTYVNGVRSSGNQVVEVGDVITIAEYRIEVRN